jgi:hypothetical protein
MGSMKNAPVAASARGPANRALPPSTLAPAQPESLGYLRTGRRWISVVGSRVRRSPAVAVFLVFFLVGLGLVWRGLDYPMVYDDLHLIRHFSASEILKSFHAAYDPDGFENAGLRPFMVLYNAGRYELFGENVVAQRVFMVAVFAAYLLAVSRIVTELGGPWGAATAAGVLTLTARYSVSHYVWLTDGIFQFQGLAFALAVLLLFASLRTNRIPPAICSLLAMAVALLTREDTIALLAIAVLLGFVYMRRGPGGRRLFATYVAALVILTGAFLVVRALFVPEAQHLGLNAIGVVYHLFLMTNMMGWQGFDAPTRGLVFAWAFITFMVIAVRLVFHPRIRALRPLLWIGCAAIACTPGLNVVRVNLLLFATTFMALFLTEVGAEIWAAAPGVRPPLLALLVVGAMGSAYLSEVTAESFHPDSATAMRWNGAMIYGQYATRATIPPSRRAAIILQMERAGIRSEQDLEERFLTSPEAPPPDAARVPGLPGQIFWPRLEGIFQP